MSNEKQEKSTRSKRRWFQFSLGSLLLLMTVFGLWFGNRMDRARRQARAVAALREIGEVSYDRNLWYSGNTRRFPKRSRWGPKWLREILSDDFFDRVYGVSLHESTTDEDLKHLRDLPEIESLLISSPQVTGAGLEHLQELHSLKEMSLVAGHVTDADLVHLETLEDLRCLDIVCPITERTVDSLASLRNLETLVISCRDSRHALTRLEDPITIEFVDEALVLVLLHLEDLFFIRFAVDEQAIRAAGIETAEIRITLTLTKQPLATALNAILKDTGLDWVLTPNAILITTEEEAAARLAPIRELQERLPNLKNVRCFVER